MNLSTNFLRRHIHTCRLLSVCVMLSLVAHPVRGEETPDVDALQRKCEQADAKAVSLVQNPSNEELDALLLAAVDEAFELRMRLHAAQIHEARDNLDNAAELLKQREQSRDEIVRQRVQRLRSGKIPTAAPDTEDPNEPATLQTLHQQLTLQDATVLDQSFINAAALLKIEVATVLPTRMRAINRELGTSYRGAVSVSKLYGMTESETHGLREQDILIGIDQWQTTDASDVSAALWMAIQSGKAKLPFYVVRAGDYVVRAGDSDQSGGMGMGMASGMGMGSGLGMDSGMGMSTDGSSWQMYRGELDRAKLLALRNRVIQDECDRREASIRSLEKKKDELLAQHVDDRIDRDDLPAQADDPKTRELVTDLTLAQATLDEFTQLAGDASIEQAEFLARLSQLLDDETVRSLTSDRQNVESAYRAILQQRVSGLQRKIDALRKLAAQEYEQRLAERRNDEKQRTTGIITVWDEEQAKLKQALQSLQKEVIQ